MSCNMLYYTKVKGMFLRHEKKYGKLWENFSKPSIKLKSHLKVSYIHPLYNYIVILYNLQYNKL
jgi:hypothetical protein